MNDTAAFLAEIDERVAGAIAELQARANRLRSDIDAGVLTLQSKADPIDAFPPLSGGLPGFSHDAFDDALSGPMDDPSHDPLMQDALADDFNVADIPQMPADDFKFDDDDGAGGLLDAPIFGGDGSNFDSGDFDFSIDVDPK
jgi:hypothetical protein